jgi:hypothetical protein
MPSIVEICNRALTTYLGGGTITSLAEDTPSAVQCNLHYEPTRIRLLEAFWWNFATKRAVLAELTNDSSVWGYRYAQPGDSLELRWVNDSFETAITLKRLNENPDVDREINASSIYCDIDTAVCEYTQDISDPTLFPPHFQDALAAQLASVIAMPITQDTAIASYAARRAGEELSRAVMLDERKQSVTKWDITAGFHTIRGVR